MMCRPDDSVREYRGRARSSLPAVTVLSSGMLDSWIWLRARRRVLSGVAAAVATVALVSCDGDNGAPTAPTPVLPDSSTGGLAPTDQAAFDARVVGRQISQGSFRLVFVAPGRIREFEDGTPYDGDYDYSRIGPNDGTLVYTYDVTANDPNRERSEVRFTFRTETSGTFEYSYFEHGARRETSRGSFQLVNAPSVQANRAPRVAAGIDDAALDAGDRATVDLEAPPRNFTDPDGDQLRYSATSSNTRVARVSLSGTVLEVLASGAGQASIHVTATDPGGLSATLTFRVTVTAGTNGDGVVTTHAGACRVGLTLGPGGSCDVGSDRFEVLSDGRGRYGCCITGGTGINVNGFRANRISGTNDWRVDALP